MSEQHQPRDFTAAEAVLVPGVLRAYRHFKIWPDGHPFMGSAFRGLGRRTDTRLWSCNAMFTSAPTYLGAGPHAAACTKIPFPFTEGTGPCPEGTAPNPRCACGFYAYYDPKHDFYPAASGWFVKAVVELSGRILMGSLGVRAERMTIRAIAPDRSKISRPRLANGDRSLLAAEQDEYVARVETLVRHAETVAAANRIPYFTRTYAMVRAWPQPDLSALLGPTTEDR